MIRKALSKGLQLLAQLPAIFGGLIPVFKACPPCPVCMPIYAAFLSFLGVRLADYGIYVVPVMLASMLLTLGTLAYQASKHHRRFEFLGLAIFSIGTILISKFGFDYVPTIYMGMAGLVCSIVGNRIALRKVSASCCANHHHHAKSACCEH